MGQLRKTSHLKTPFEKATDRLVRSIISTARTKRARDEATSARYQHALNQLPRPDGGRPKTTSILRSSRHRAPMRPRPRAVIRAVQEVLPRPVFGVCLQPLERGKGPSRSLTVDIVHRRIRAGVERLEAGLGAGQGRAPDLVELFGRMDAHWPLVDDFIDERVGVWRYYRYYCVAGDALELIARRYVRKRRQLRSTLRELLDRCRLCWRYGRPGLKYEYYCPTHVPHPDNKAYKRALRRLSWRRRPWEFPYVDRVHGALRRRYRLRVDPAGDALTSVLTGGSAKPRDFPRRIIGLPRCLRRVPYVRAYLKEQNVPLRSARAILRALDPVGRYQKQLHNLLHRIAARDQHQLWIMLTWAEAWLATMRKNWGGARRRKAQLARAKTKTANELVADDDANPYPGHLN